MNPFVSLFLFGLAGSLHCIAMCGAFSCGASFSPSGSRRASLARALIFNSGRILSYGALGVLVGAWGLSAYALLPSTTTERVLRFSAGVAVVLFGISLLGVHLGGDGPIAWLWKKLERHVAHLFPVANSRRAFVLGTVWGLLPCGFLYAALLTAASLVSPVRSGLAMIAFGMGTIPAMVASAFGFSAFAQRRMLRRIGSFVVIASGVWICWMAAGDAASPHACCVAAISPM